MFNLETDNSKNIDQGFIFVFTQGSFKQKPESNKTSFLYECNFILKSSKFTIFKLNFTLRTCSDLFIVVDPNKCFFRSQESCLMN